GRVLVRVAGAVAVPGAGLPGGRIGGTTLAGRGAGAAAGWGRGGSWALLEVFITFSMALAMASGQEVTGTSLCRRQEGQRMPLSWVMISSLSTPERRAMDTSRAVASDWEGQPPARPVLVKTSQMPCSS